MPLPEDQKMVQTCHDVIAAFRQVFGKHPGYRPAHAHGVLLTGTFKPAAKAAELSSASHFSDDSTPITVRFSSSTGIPDIPDTNRNANPRGLAIRFHLGGRKHTDIIAHSTPFFPTRNGPEFLEFLQALIATGAAGAQGVSPSPIEKFLGSHPAALAFVQAPKPSPESLADEAYYGVNAFKLVSGGGKATYFRYQVLPLGGVKTLDEESLKSKSDTYLFDDLSTCGPFSLKLMAQLAQEGDVTTDASVHWPEDRDLVTLGTLTLDTVVPADENKKQQKYDIFDPIPRVEGLEASEDPMLEFRAALYLISGRERRLA